MLPPNIKTLLAEVVLHTRREHARDKNGLVEDFTAKMFRQGLGRSSAFIEGMAKTYCESFEKYANGVWHEMQSVLEAGFEYYPNCEQDLIGFLKQSLAETHDSDKAGLEKGLSNFKGSHYAFHLATFTTRCGAVTDKLVTEIKISTNRLRAKGKNHTPQIIQRGDNQRPKHSGKSNLLIAAEWMWSHRKEDIQWNPGALTKENVEDPTSPKLSAVEAMSIFRQLEERGLIYPTIYHGHQVYLIHVTKIHEWETFISELINGRPAGAGVNDGGTKTVKSLSVVDWCTIVGAIGGIIVLIWTICWGVFIWYRPSANEGQPSGQAAAHARPVRPDTIISNPAPLSAATSTKQVTNAEPATLFETNSPSMDDGDVEAEFQKAKAKHDAEEEAERQKDQTDDQAMWKNNLPLFNFALESLYNILNREKEKRGDGIAKTPGYFQCLPTVINFEMPETNVAEIRFQKNTNLDFKIAITSGEVVGPTIQPNGLKIICSCGHLDLCPFWFMSGNHLHLAINVPGYNDDQTTLDSDSRAPLDNALKILVAAQIDSLSQTNRSEIK